MQYNVLFVEATVKHVAFDQPLPGPGDLSSGNIDLRLMMSSKQHLIRRQFSVQNIKFWLVLVGPKHQIDNIKTTYDPPSVFYVCQNILLFPLT